MKAIMKYPGSKWNMAKTIVSLMPEHKSYLEPYFGSGAVLFTKPVAPIETINDISGDVVNLFRTIREHKDELAAAIYYTPYSEQEYEQAFNDQSENPVERARLFLIRSLQSHGFSTYRKVGWKVDVQGREKSYCVKHWNEIPNIIHETAERLKKVQIANTEAVELIRRFNYDNVFIYLDPPYMLEARSSKRKQYEYEMTEADHIRLLETISKSKAKIMISGYQTDLYDEILKSWNRHEYSATAQMGLPRKEILWTNYEEHQISIAEFMEETAYENKRL